ncbi:MAG: 50S ribosomal protein L16 [Herpetosiphonaceae bacterium]|nr:50S ribosomal protein L16 [Herpetosiphonaceae bacterium]
MLMPKRMKYRKMHRGVGKGTRIAGRGTTVAFGDVGLMALDSSWVNSRQIEAARRAITNYVKRGGKVWIRIFPDKPVTTKPAETRMGSGKGAVEYYVAIVKPGRVMFELGGVRQDVAEEALRRGAQKLPIKCKLVYKDTAGEVVHANEGE